MVDGQTPSTISYNKTSGLQYKNTKFVCKFCKVEVCGKTDTHAVMGHEHKKSCPRRSKF